MLKDFRQKIRQNYWEKWGDMMNCSWKKRSQIQEIFNLGQIVRGSVSRRQLADMGELLWKVMH